MKKIGAFNIATALIGTLIGAGFASGQELMQFFGDFGTKGVITSAAVGLAFAALSIIIMFTARNMGSVSYEEVAVPNIPALRVFVNAFITLFLAGVLVVMIAGAGAMVKALWGLPPIFGNAAMAAVLLLTGLLGSEKLLSGFNFVVPIMMAIALAAAISGALSGPGSAVMEVSENASSLSGNFAFSGALYVGYNLTASLAVLAPIGVYAKSRRGIVAGSLIGGLSLGVMAVLICIAIVKNYALVASEEMPMLTIARMGGPVLGAAYCFALLAGIYTTAAGFLFGLMERLAQYEAKPLQNRRLVTIAVSLGAFALSNLGFSEIIGTLYPVSGYISLVILAFLIYNFIKSRKQKKRRTA